MIFVGSCDARGKPNSAPKMLVDINHPSHVYFLDYKYTKTYSNIIENDRISISFMDDEIFRGFKLNGTCKIIQSGREFEATRRIWGEKVVSYEASRIVERIKGETTTRQAENALPKDFVIVKVTASEGSVVEPTRVLRSRRGSK